MANPVIGSIRTVTNNPSQASALQRQLQSYITQIERRTGRAEASLETAQTPGMNAEKELRRFRNEFQNIERAKRELEKIASIPDKLAKTISKLAKSFAD